MIEFAASLRRVLISIIMVLMLLICVFKYDVESTLGVLIIVALICLAGLYLFISFISMIVRLIRRARMDETEQMKDTFSGILVYYKNYEVLSFFRGLAFWGFIMLIVNITAFNVTGSMLIGGPYATDSFLAGYHGFLSWSIFALLFSFVLSVFYWWLYMPHYGEGTYNTFQFVGKVIASDIAAPFRTIKKACSKTDDGSRYKGSLLGLIVIILFLIVNILAVIKSV